jgi:DsbC/DsbD-like thiol-disulfide interchange protein
MKKGTFLFLIVTFLSLSTYSQILKPVTWSYAATKNGNAEATIYLKATIDNGWHLYSQKGSKEGGPVKTTFTYEGSKDFKMVGKTIEPKSIVKFEPLFSMDIAYFENSVVFQQKIKMKGTNTIVKGNVEFMVCNDKQCLPPSQVDFAIPVN